MRFAIALVTAVIMTAHAAPALVSEALAKRLVDPDVSIYVIDEWAKRDEVEVREPLVDPDVSIYVVDEWAKKRENEVREPLVDPDVSIYVVDEWA
ncbi:hypothetical protein DL96DRAFT_1111727 [Flagelloscypha sp. PMI_526]|nr:hypothetical protein DL96DRAFT_1111727 [Flagelloscypha sp. PMI_526]